MNTNKKTKASYITDFGIRIYAPKVNKSYWRISYVDQEGKLRDTTATSERMAMEKASDIEKLLRNNLGNLPHNKVSTEKFTLSMKTNSRHLTLPYVPSRHLISHGICRINSKNLRSMGTIDCTISFFSLVTVL